MIRELRGSVEEGVCEGLEALPFLHASIYMYDYEQMILWHDSRTYDANSYNKEFGGSLALDVTSSASPSSSSSSSSTSSSSALLRKLNVKRFPASRAAAKVHEKVVGRELWECFRLLC